MELGTFILTSQMKAKRARQPKQTSEPSFTVIVSQDELVRIWVIPRSKISAFDFTLLDRITKSKLEDKNYMIDLVALLWRLEGLIWEEERETLTSVDWLRCLTTMPLESLGKWQDFCARGQVETKKTYKINLDF
jgi:hypothetical protein